MKDICLKIDYQNCTINWWDWTDKDKEETKFIPFVCALYSCHKIKNTLLDIYATLLEDMWAIDKVSRNAEENIISFGENTKILLAQKIILIKSIYGTDSWKVYKQNIKTGELELL